MSETKRLHAQVAVVGAGSGGFAVAYTLAKQGVKTIVIEKNLGFGGTSVYGGVNCWEPGVASGELHWLIYEKLSAVPNACAVCESVSDPRYPWGLSVPSKEATYEDTLKRCPTLVDRKDLKRFQFEPEAMNRVMGELLQPYMTHLTVLFGTEYCACTTQGELVRSIVVHGEAEDYEVFADYFVDSTGDILLARDAGCEVTIGRESKQAYNEPSAGETDKKAINGVSYLFRIKPTDNPNHVDDYELNDSALPRTNIAACFNVYPNGEININMCPTLTGKEYIELGDSADEVGRATALRYWHHLQVDRGVTGYTLVDFFPMPGIREGYRLVGKYVLTEHDLLVDAAQHRFLDAMATIADHARDRHGETGDCQDVPTPYEIPIGCTETKEFSNLFVACRGASFSSIAASSARLTRTMLGLGEAVGHEIVKRIERKREMNGKVVLITGGSSGYGKATAEKMVKQGATVIITARNRDMLEQAKEEIGCSSVICMDVTNYADWQSAYKTVVEQYGRLDVLVNNAGGGVAIKSVTEQTQDEIDRSIALNLTGAIYGTNVFAPLMKEQKSGTIINVSSVCAKQAWPGFSIYGAAKAGMLGFSKGAYVDLRPHNIRVTCLIPASASTGFEKSANLAEGVHQMTVNDVADSILYICNLPQHAVVEELTVWGIDQEVIPL
ncbi:MAG: SDR family NAD(P)-dependent oxidoreductase [Clostridia bacterium]|nr:SDR family NAD(P)-dependent oxidoreductase [Clostridia bacterium]